MKIKIFAFVFAILLTAFTIYAVLDTFVISRVYQPEVIDTDTFLQSQAALANNNGTQNDSDPDVSVPDVSDPDVSVPDVSDPDVSDQDDYDPVNPISENENQKESVQQEIDTIQEDMAQQGETEIEKNTVEQEENELQTEENSTRRSTRNDSSSGDSNNSENNTDDDDSNNWENQGNSSDDSTDEQETRRPSSNDNTDEQETRRPSSNNNDRWGNRRSSTNNGDSGNWSWDDDTNNGDSNNWSWNDDTNNGDSGNWSWDDDTTNDGPLESTVTDEEALKYTDENIQITITLYEVNDSVVYAADVRISSAEYLKSAFAKDKYGKNVIEKTSEIAASQNAILAINGDYYGARESGYVIRNGVLYRDKADDAYVLCIYADGTMEIIDPSEITAQELLDQGVWQAYSFGPALVIDGEIIDTSEMTSTNRKRGWGWGSTESNNPRTAIGIYEPLHYLFLVTDGRTDESEGLTLTELAEFMYNMGVTTAYNLDGGGSSTMVFQDEVVNQPTSYGSRITERSISDILYIGYK